MIITMNSRGTSSKASRSHPMSLHDKRNLSLRYSLLVWTRRTTEIKTFSSLSRPIRRIHERFGGLKMPPNHHHQIPFSSNPSLCWSSKKSQRKKLWWRSKVKKSKNSQRVNRNHKNKQMGWATGKNSSPILQPLTTKPSLASLAQQALRIQNNLLQ